MNPNRTKTINGIELYNDETLFEIHSECPRVVATGRVFKENIPALKCVGRMKNIWIYNRQKKKFQRADLYDGVEK